MSIFVKIKMKKPINIKVENVTENIHASTFEVSCKVSRKFSKIVMI